GGADRSYGIEVGRLAGLPPVVLTRARQLLGLLEAEQIVPRSSRSAAADRARANDQLGLFAVIQHRVVDELRTLDPNKMTPFQSLELLARLVDEVKRDARQG
ncbi:MAG TPA: hypothetical protein VM166_00290, partial [Gemmatimonadaceae bacterium]|nr:hypothetical protein [Gemmatimonadaceae bacterium]